MILNRFKTKKRTKFFLFVLLLIAFVGGGYLLSGSKSPVSISSDAITIGEDKEKKEIAENIEKYHPQYDWFKDHPTNLGLTAKSAIVINLDKNQVVYALNEHEKLPPASITKILTLTVVLENMKTETLCTVSPQASSVQPNKISMRAGEQMTVEDLLFGLTMISANDAAEVLAECFDGGRDKFIEKMNDKVRLLGLDDSKFIDPSGLDDETQYSCAFDIATITGYLLTTKPEAIKYLGRKDDYSVFPSERNESHYWYQMSRLLFTYPGMEGAKTGYTHIAKNTYVGIANRNNNRIVIVYFAAETTTSDATTLLEYGLSQNISL